MQIKYGVANAAGTSTGVIVLQPPALATSNSVPKADNITTQVRTDGIVSIDVLDHVTYADGTTVACKTACNTTRTRSKDSYSYQATPYDTKHPTKPDPSP